MIALVAGVVSDAVGGHFWERHALVAGLDVTPIRSEYLVATIDELADDDAVVSADTCTACIWTARYITAKQKRSIFGSF